MKKLILCCIATVFFPLILHAASSPSLPDPAIILKASDRARGGSSGLRWTIEIDSVENGRKQQRSMVILAQDDNSLARFTAPAKVKGQIMLMRDRNMWFCKPGLQKPVPISPRQKLMGGAANADIASTNYAKDYHVAEMAEETWNDQPCYRLDLQAVNPKVAYDRIIYWISQEDHLGIKAEFYSKSGKMFKYATFEYLNELDAAGEKRPFVSKMIIHDNVIKNNITTLTYRDIEIKEIATSTFNLNLITR